MGHAEILIGFIMGGLLWCFVFIGGLVKKNTKKESPISDFSVVELSNDDTSEVHDFVYIPVTEDRCEDNEPTERPERAEELPDDGQEGNIDVDADYNGDTDDVFAGDSVKDEPVYKVDEPDKPQPTPEPEQPTISNERANSWQWVSNRYRIVIDNVSSGDRDTIVNICKQLGVHYTII